MCRLINIQEISIWVPFLNPSSTTAWFWNLRSHKYIPSSAPWRWVIVNAFNACYCSINKGTGSWSLQSSNLREHPCLHGLAIPLISFVMFTLILLQWPATGIQLCGQCPVTCHHAWTSRLSFSTRFGSWQSLGTGWRRNVVTMNIWSCTHTVNTAVPLPLASMSIHKLTHNSMLHYGFRCLSTNLAHKYKAKWQCTEVAVDSNFLEYSINVICHVEYQM